MSDLQTCLFIRGVFCWVSQTRRRAMPEKRSCSSCGAELPVDARGGLCVPCALQRVLDGSLEPGAETAPLESAGKSQAGGQRETAVLSFVTEKAGDQIGRY